MEARRACSSGSMSVASPVLVAPAGAKQDRQERLDVLVVWTHGLVGGDRGRLNRLPGLLCAPEAFSKRPEDAEQAGEPLRGDTPRRSATRLRVCIPVRFRPV